jgi:C4-dicarboxylate-specific signal transduction histidine kinase
VEGNLSANIIYDENGAEIASVGIFVDLEEQLKMERKLHNTQEQLLQSEKLAAMGRLTSQIAHELNNPLYGIMNTLELMKTEIPVRQQAPQTAGHVPVGNRAGDGHAAQNALLFQTGPGRAGPGGHQHDPGRNSAAARKTAVGAFHQSGAQFADHLGKVHASKNQLRQVFLNLISNARDAMPEAAASP